MSPYGLAVDSKNNLYIAGWATDGLEVGTGPLPGGGIFLAKLDPQGEALWARRYIDTGADPSILSLWPLEFGVPCRAASSRAPAWPPHLRWPSGRMTT